MTAGFFGKVPAAGDFVSWNLPRAFTDRWDRWMSRDLIEHPSRGPLDPRAWRFAVPAGIFCDAPAAGVWRMSEDRAGRRYPFVVAAIGASPDPADPWFDGAARLLAAAAATGLQPARLGERLGGLSEPGTVTPRPGAIVFWNDDWEVRELTFATIHDLAANGLPAMRVARARQEIP